MARQKAERFNLRHLEIFRAVQRTGSVTEAAKLFGVSQPAASRMLREAENAFGTRLFERRGGRLIARVEAQPFADAIERVFFEMERVRLLADELQRPVAPRMRIGAIPAAVITLLPPAVAALHRTYPTLKVDTYALPTQQIVEQVAVGMLDLGLVYSPKDHAGVAAIELADSELVCAMRPDHALARMKVVTPKELERHGFISFHLDEPISLAIREGFRAAGTRCNPLVQVNQSSAACALAEAGAGVAIVTPFALAGGRFPELITRPFRPRITLKAQILHAQHAAPSAVAQALIQLLRETVEKRLARLVPGSPS